MTDTTEFATFDIYDPGESEAVVKQVGFNVGDDVNILLNFSAEGDDMKIHITAGGGPTRNAEGIAEIGQMLVELGNTILEGQVD